MKFFDKAYVGFQRSRYAQGEEPRILGFLVPEGTTKAELKRKATVDRWRQEDIEPRIIDNAPTRGFKLAEVVSRWSTSNKLFRVLDPRGFELEITADNLLSIATHGSIIRGEIVEECVWVTDGSLTLLPTTDPRYLRQTSTKLVDVKAVDAGKYFTSPGNLVSLFRFEGMFDVLYSEFRYEAVKWDVEKPSNGYGHGFYNRLDNHNVTEYETLVDVKSKRLAVYTEFYLDDEGEVAKKTIHFRNSQLKKMQPCVTVPVSAIQDKLVHGEPINPGRQNITGVFSSYGTRCVVPFPDKKSAGDFDLGCFAKALPERPSPWRIDHPSWGNVNRTLSQFAKTTVKVIDLRNT